MQNKVKIFNDNKNCNTKLMPVYSRILDINSELGELAKEYLKSTHYGIDEFNVTHDFEMEFGDVLYSILSLANEVNISADKCLDMALKKYNDRIAKNKNMGSEN